MNIEVYDYESLDKAEPILEELRKKIATIAGVTLMGNRLTVRWGDGECLKDVHMIILSVDDGKSEPPPEIPK